MNRKTVVFLLLAIILLAIALTLFCMQSPSDVEKPPAPRLWEDASFQASLAKSGKRGLQGIAVVAPASGLSDENARKALEMAGRLDIRLSADAMRYGVVPYTANSDSARLEQLLQALNDSETEVLWAVRGGYGSSRLLAELAKSAKPETAKIFVGYSDLTFLHLFLHQWGWRTVHGGMFWELSGTEEGHDVENYRLLASLLAGELDELRYDGLKPFNSAAEALSRPVEGLIIGGNLTCLAAAVGTPWPPEGSGKILFLEDVKEKGYKLDRMLVQLKEAGIFDGVGAVILGDFTKGDDNVDFALERFAKELSAPVFRTDLFGHGRKNYPLILNGRAVIEKTSGDGNAFGLRMDAKQLP